MRLREKVLVFFLVGALFSGGSVTLLTKRVIHDVLVEEFGQRSLLKLTDLPMLVLPIFKPRNERELLVVLRQVIERTGALYAMVLDNNGKVIVQVNPLVKGKIDDDPKPQELAGIQPPSYRQRTIDGQIFLEISVPVWVAQGSGGESRPFEATRGRSEPLGTVRVGFSLGEVLATVDRIADQVIWIVVLTMGAVLGSVLFLIRGHLKRIRSLAEGTERVSRGEYGAVVPVCLNDELGNLAHCFNQMSERLARRDELILSSAGEGIFGLNGEGNATFVNPTGARILGYRMDELIGKPMHLMIHHFRSEGASVPVDPCPIAATFTDGTVHHVTDEVFWRQDGTNFPVEYVSTPIRERDQVVGAVVVFKDITERKAQAAVLEFQATHDALTGLPNRTLLADHIGQAISRARLHKRLVAVLVLDLDNFKKINDTVGHDFGDLLLKDVGARLCEGLRKGDSVARLGGDEFVLVLTDLTQEEDVAKIAGKVLKGISQPFDVAGVEVVLTASIGISLYPSDGINVETLLKNADTAMYRAKEQGKNHYRLFSAAMNVRVLERLVLETELHRALEKEEFLLYYQPQVELRSGRIVGMEALLRWNRPRGALVAPNSFIGLAEETGLIIPIGEWALRAACQELKIWQELGVSSVHIAVNLSARQFQQGNLLEMVSRVLAETGLLPEFLELELTESILVQREEETISALNGLKEIGVQLSIDDFGTGYSSLSYLKRFPIDSLKVDQSFVRGIPTDPENVAIVRAIVTLAHSLRLKVIAEAVESLPQLKFLQELNCDEVQGFFFSEPLPSEQARKLLSRNVPFLETGLPGPLRKSVVRPTGPRSRPEKRMS